MPPFVCHAPLQGGIDGDLCCLLTAGGASKEAVAVVWPTAEKLKLLKQLAGVSHLVTWLHPKHPKHTMLHAGLGVGVRDCEGGGQQGAR